MYTTSILSGCKPDKNIEEMHYIQVSLYRGLRKVLEKNEVASTDNRNNDTEFELHKDPTDNKNMMEA